MIYLDNSATTKPKKEVLDTFIKVNEQYYANPASIHMMGNQAEDLLEKARTQIADLLGMDRIIFTSGGTEANNLALQGIAEAAKARGMHLITAVSEHSSVLKTMEALEKRGFEITRLPVGRKGEIDLMELKKAIREDTVLVSLMHVNNEIGGIHPIAEVKKLLMGTRTLLHCDGVQSVGKVAMDPQYMPDLLTVSGHKIHGLKGSGVLAYKKGVELAPVQHGGGHESGLRSGTVSVADAVAMAKALRLAEIRPEFANWNKQLRNFLADFNGVRVVSPEGAAPHILAIAIKGIKGEVFVSGLQEQSVIVSTSSACSSKSTSASHVIDGVGLPREFKDGVIRISFGAFTTTEDILSFQKAFAHVYAIIKGA